MGVTSASLIPTVSCPGVCPQPTGKMLGSIFLDNFSYPANLPILKPDFNPTGMKGSACKQGLYNTSGPFSCPLILFKDNIYFQARVDFFSVFSVHIYVVRCKLYVVSLLSGRLGMYVIRCKLYVVSLLSGRLGICKLYVLFFFPSSYVELTT
jgi:hypothetical protein